MNLMSHGVEHETPRTVFCCAVSLATLDALRRSHRSLYFKEKSNSTVLGVSIDRRLAIPYH